MRGRRVLPIAFAAVVLVLGQLAALAHEAGTRHVTCGLHGEELEAATLVDQPHACDQDHLVGVTGKHGGDHADCAIARALHQSTQTSRAIAAPLPIHLVTATRAPALADVAHTTALYLIAPKTSPPAPLRT